MSSNRTQEDGVSDRLPPTSFLAPSGPGQAKSAQLVPGPMSTVGAWLSPLQSHLFSGSVLPIMLYANLHFQLLSTQSVPQMPQPWGWINMCSVLQMKSLRFREAT